MFQATLCSFLAGVLACTVPLANAQSYQDTQRLYDEQRRQQQEANREAQKRRESELNFETVLRDAERDRERGAATAQGSGGGGSLLPVIMLAIIGGLLIEGSRRPERARPVADYVRETQRQRQGFVYRQCKSLREAQLAPPRYEKPNSWPIVRIFQSDRAGEFKAAMEKYQTALAETEPACTCAGDAAVSAGGFSEDEWKAISALPRTDRPWMALDESRVRGVFAACEARSPSDAALSWLYAGATR